MSRSVKNGRMSVSKLVVLVMVPPAVCAISRVFGAEPEIALSKGPRATSKATRKARAERERRFAAFRNYILVLFGPHNWTEASRPKLAQWHESPQNPH